MNKRFVGVLVFAFVVASVASLLLYRLLNNRAQATKAAVPQMTQIVVAAKDLETGMILKAEDVKLADWNGPPPVGALTKIDGPDGAVGRGVTASMVAKEPVLNSRLAAPGAGGGLMAQIPKGMRAVAIRVNDVVGVSGFVSTGSHVDVLISGTRPNGNGNLGTITKTLLQDLEVLSAGQEIKKDNENHPVAVGTVNLLVTPEQAEQLSLASNLSIQLVLRNPLDRDMAKVPGTSMKNLFDGGRLDVRQANLADAGASADAPRPPVRRSASATHVTPAVMVERPPEVRKPDPPVTMEIVSGTKKTEVQFQKTAEGK
ncbi:MAG TPA: Flp pilus assembly protein CpaB [Verrucomicrobiae bacterium]|nr:Flp pilus assembly protein CpaB [Verrucomicrobiae bacterium]